MTRPSVYYQLRILTVASSLERARAEVRRLEADRDTLIRDWFTNHPDMSPSRAEQELGGRISRWNLRRIAGPRSPSPPPEHA